MPTQVRIGWRSGSSSQTAASIVTSGLILNLDAGNTTSYSGTGTTWTDLSSTGNNGTLTNGTGYSSQNGGVMTFDGVNDFVDCGNSSTFNQTNALTLSTWVKINSLSSENTLIGKQWCNLNQYSYFLYVDKQGKLVFNTANSGECNGFFSTYTSTNSLSINTWYNVVISFTNTSIKIYLNGQLISGSLSGINTGLFVGNAPVLLGTYRSLNGNYGLMLNGSMGSTLIYNTALSASEVTQNFDATKTRFGYSTLDTDVQAFVTAASIVDATQQNAVNTLVTSLKSAGIWTKMKAVYPFVGGNATSHKFNLKDPRDLDAAFRLQFNGGWTHTSTGALPNGTNGYADTFLTPSTNYPTVSDVSIGFYSRTNIFQESSDISSYQNSSKALGIQTRWTDNKIYSQLYRDTQPYNIVATNTNSSGFFTLSRTSTTLIKQYRNSSILGTSTAYIEGSIPTIPICLSNNGANGSYSSREQAFAFIGNGLTDAEAANFYNAVQAFQTTLGRQV